jgi:predicted Zn-ribbon and HTH transcriptional regulator
VPGRNEVDGAIENVHSVAVYTVSRYVFCDRVAFTSTGLNTFSKFTHCGFEQVNRPCSFSTSTGDPQSHWITDGLIRIGCGYLMDIAVASWPEKKALGFVPRSAKIPAKAEQLSSAPSSATRATRSQIESLLVQGEGKVTTSAVDQSQRKARHDGLRLVIMPVQVCPKCQQQVWMGVDGACPNCKGAPPPAQADASAKKPRTIAPYIGGALIFIAVVGGLSQVEFSGKSLGQILMNSMFQVTALMIVVGVELILMWPRKWIWITVGFFFIASSVPYLLPSKP